jgi:tRNA nucleotidyltransferase (CCA-adding enzyme)
MADYIYLLQTRLTPAQQTALQHVRDAARLRGMTVFLVGGAVRDLTSGTPSATSM